MQKQRTLYMYIVAPVNEIPFANDHLKEKAPRYLEKCHNLNLIFLSSMIINLVENQKYPILFLHFIFHLIILKFTLRKIYSQN